LSDADIPNDPLPKRESSFDGSININTVNNFSFLLDDFKMFECFLNLPDKNALPFALDLQRIATGQQNDQDLWQRHLTNPLSYPEEQFGNIRVLSY
jgi:hypothetical protein